MNPPILCIDFDGVLHSYYSGWKGPRNIPDPPVLGAIEWLDDLVENGDKVSAMAPRYREFDVCIFSSRSRYLGGRRAMKRWLVKWGFPEDKLENIRFPLLKPAAHLQIDDRAMQFKGTFPTIKEMKAFRPWNRRSPVDTLNGTSIIGCERQRQLRKGWSQNHDQFHSRGQLIVTAAKIALYGTDYIAGGPDGNELFDDWKIIKKWEEKEGNPERREIRLLGIAGALIAAEIDRLMSKNNVTITENEFFA